MHPGALPAAAIAVAVGCGALYSGPVFRADPNTLCEDRYHPSADGYRVWAYALLPAVAHAAGVSPTLP